MDLFEAKKLAIDFFSLQQFEFEMNVGNKPFNYFGNMKVTNFIYLIPNFLMPTFVIQENPQSSGEEITTCEIHRPPSASLLNELSSYATNEILIINNVGNEDILDN